MFFSEWEKYAEQSSLFFCFTCKRFLLLQNTLACELDTDMPVFQSTTDDTVSDTKCKSKMLE